MKTPLIIFVFLIFGLSVHGQNTSGINLDLMDLSGKWYIIQTNFPMWLKGNKTNPTFNYTFQIRKHQAILLDEVIYTKKGKEKKITGYDKPDDLTNTLFTWRGKGILKLLKSKWKILYLDKADQWAIIYFEMTLFTPAGYDVISRKPVASSKINQAINKQLNTLGIKEKLTPLPVK